MATDRVRHFERRPNPQLRNQVNIPAKRRFRTRPTTEKRRHDCRYYLPASLGSSARAANHRLLMSIPLILLQGPVGPSRAAPRHNFTEEEHRHLAQRNYEKAFERFRREEEAKDRVKAEQKRRRKEAKVKEKARAKAEAKAPTPRLKKTKTQRLKTYLMAKVLRCHT